MRRRNKRVDDTMSSLWWAWCDAEPCLTPKEFVAKSTVRGFRALKEKAKTDAFLQGCRDRAEQRVMDAEDAIDYAESDASFRFCLNLHSI